VASVWHVFQSCGWASWLCLLAGLLAVPLSLVALSVVLLRARVGKLLSWIALVICVLPFGIGIAGRQLGRSKIDMVISGPEIDPAFRGRIREEGYKEADQCVAVGGTLSTLPALLALCALLTAQFLPSKPST
jgi:hypothetical protein